MYSDPPCCCVTTLLQVPSHHGTYVGGQEAVKQSSAWHWGLRRTCDSLSRFPRAPAFCGSQNPSPAVPPQTGNPGTKHMPLTTREKVVENTTRFQFVLWRRGKNSSQSNNHHRELTDLSQEQHHWKAQSSWAVRESSNLSI